MLQFLDPIHWIKTKFEQMWQGRFRRGFLAELLMTSFVKFPHGVRVRFSLGHIASAGTGHWPFNLFEVHFQTGPKGDGHVTLLGWTLGWTWVYEVHDDINQIGVHRRKFYGMFSCINHQNQQLEEIINS